MTITGTFLTGATAVSFNGTAAAYTVVNSTSITTTVPTGATTGTVSVITPLGTATGPVFTISGAALNPEINVQQAATNLASGSTFSGFAAATIGSPATAVTFTIQNTSTTDALTLSGFTFAGPFAISGTTPTSVAAAGSVAFDVVFTPTQSGTNTGSVSIANNDQDENPYVINFEGTGNNPAPTITSLTPSSATTSSTITTLTIVGTNFVSGATVTFAGTSYPTATLTSGQITVSNVAVPATAGSYDVTVTNPAPGGGTSAAATFAATTPFSGIIEDFEAAVSKTAYTAGSLALTTGSWTFDEAALGTLANDKKNGAKSARLRGGSIYMNFDKPNGAGIITVQAARYGTDAASSFVVEVSDDGGASFTAYTSAVTATTATLAGYTFTANVGGPIRVRIRHIGGSVGNDPRLNIDDVSISDYSPTGPEIKVTQSPANTNVSTGGTVSVASTAVGSSTDVSFTITNEGTTPLNLGTVIASNAEFTIPGPDLSNTTIAANGGTATFTVRFAPVGAGPRSGTIQIPNNDVTGNEDPFVINFTGTGTAVYYAKATGDLNDPATFGVNTDGSGASPAGFTAAGQVFTVTGTSRTIGANLTISGAGSKLVLASGAEFIIPAAFNYTGPLDLGAGSTLVVQNSTIAYTLGTIDATSTIDYAQTGSFVVPIAPNYGNLKLTNGTKTLAGSSTLTTTVRGNFTLDNVTGFGGPTSTPFATLSLAGNFTLQGTVGYGSLPGRVTVQLDGTTAQTLTGNGNDFNLFRLTNNNTTAGAALAGTGSSLVLANATSGGLTLNTGTSLALNGNTVTLTGNGTFVGTGTLTNATNGTVNVAKSGSTDPGTVYFGTGETLGTLTLNPTGNGDELFLGSSVTVNNLNLTDGVLRINGQTLTLNGPVTSVAGQLRGAATSSLAFTGTGSIGSLNFVNGSATLASLTLNRTTNAVISLAENLSVVDVAFTGGSLFFTPSTRLTVTGTLTGGSASSFANALTLPTGANATPTLTFPLGGALGFYRPVTLALTQSAATATSYTARLQELTGNGRGVTAPLTNVSAVRYVTLSKETGGATLTGGTITLGFGEDDGVNDQATLRLAGSPSSGTAYADLGTPTVTGSFPGSGFATGTISATITTLGDFALATDATAAGLNPLPVELTAFTAQRQGSGALLQWITAQEKNSARFEVLRSTDGGREFRSVGTVQAAGHSSTTRTYTFPDRILPTGPVYYRLRTVDTDGSAAESAIVALSGTGKLTVLAYPNPVQDELRLEVGAETGEWRLLNLLGQPVRSGKVQSSTTLDLRGLPAGQYQLEVRTATQRVVRALSKTN